MKPRITLPHQLTQTPFTVLTGRNAGMSNSRLRGRDLHRPFHGIRMVKPRQPQRHERGTSPSAGVAQSARAIRGHGTLGLNLSFSTANLGELSLDDLALAYQAGMPEHAFFCSITAALAWGIPLPLRQEQQRTLHVAVPVPHTAPRGRGIAGHQVNVGARDIRLWNGVRISSPERVWCELGAILRLPDLVAAGDFLISRRRPFTSKDKLEQAIETYPGQRGKRLLRVALQLLTDRSDSRPESHLRVILVLANFVGLAVNLPIQTRSGYRYFADLAFPTHKMLLEYQGDYHRASAQFRADMTRRSRLEADGWFVMLINADDLRDPEELLQRIRNVLADHPAR